MKHKWTIYNGSRFIDSGTIEAETEREALATVLLEQGEGKDPETAYSITVGDMSTSSYGDEFEQSASATGWSDEPEMDGGYAFQPKLDDSIEKIGKAMARAAVKEIAKQVRRLR